MVKDMTKGSPMKLILGFAVPLLFGFLFQQFYNVVDSMIVGKILGPEALASVGATGAINFLIIGFCMGCCNGFSIPLSHKFGAGDYEGLRRFAANCVYLAIAFAIVMTALTTMLCYRILVWMKTPADIIDGSYRYIWIIFLGIPTVYLYNMVSAVIRSLGDSKTPVFFLLLSSVINIGLDLFFILVIGTGVEGAAIATVISQLISGVSCLLYMMKRYEILRLKKEEWRADRHLMGTLCGMGIPMGLQYSVTAIGSVILQSATNTLGSMAVAAVTAGNRVSGFLATPFDAMGSTMATYGGQNIGAGKIERLDKGLKDCVIIGAVYSAFAFLFCLFCGKQLALLFIDSAEVAVIENVKFYLIIYTAFYFPLALVNIIRFLIQGMGFPTFAILAGVFEMISRTFAGIFLVPALGFLGACMGSPLAWILADAFLIPAYFFVRKKVQIRRNKEMT